MLAHNGRCSAPPAARARAPVPGGPRLSQACGELLRRIRIVDEYGDDRVIEVPVERPLSISLDNQIVATLWTLGASAAHALAGLGFRVIGWSRSAKQIEAIASRQAYVEQDQIERIFGEFSEADFTGLRERNFEIFRC